MEAKIRLSNPTSATKRMNRAFCELQRGVLFDDVSKRDKLNEGGVLMEGVWGQEECSVSDTVGIWDGAVGGYCNLHRDGFGRGIGFDVAVYVAGL